LWNATQAIGYPYSGLFSLIALTAVRISEAAEAQWREFDLAKKLWTIPPERFKSETPHLVPLSDDAVKLIETLPRWSGGEFLFSTTSGKKAVNGFSSAKKRLDSLMVAELGGVPERWSAHDIRRSVRTRLSELKVEERVAEMIIGHGRRGLVRVYDQHQFLAEQRQALQKWAARLDTIVNGGQRP
jgi:integrase